MIVAGVALSYLRHEHDDRVQHEAETQHHVESLACCDGHVASPQLHM